MSESDIRSVDQSLGATIGRAWEGYWFQPAAGKSLAVVRIVTGVLGLLLCASYAIDLLDWFGPLGWLPVDSVTPWRSPFAFSIFDVCATNAAVTGTFYGLVFLFILLTIGFVTPVTSLLAALGWASLLHRGPMLAGPADDGVAVLLWCLVIGASGEHFSVDAMLHRKFGWHLPRFRVRSRISVGLLQVHAAVISGAALLSQLKGDVWWNGTAVWWIATRKPGRLFDTTDLLLQSEYVCNALTHGIILWEALVIGGIWFASTQKVIARAGLVIWPIVGVLTSCPLWGVVMAVMTIPLTQLLEEERLVDDRDSGKS
ncbi:hypothetical protein N9B71_04870 [Pirellulales bacterium]|nr:hypothetical protein [Pirellulales bacterium]